MWIKKSGRVGSALILAMARLNVAVTSLFGSLVKPMWLSLTWANVKSTCCCELLLRPARGT